MKIQKETLSRAINRLKGIVPKRPQMACVDGMLVEGRWLYASGGDMEAMLDLGCETEAPFIIPSSSFGIINAMPSGDLEITASETGMSMKVGHSKTKFAMLETSNFPKLVPVDGEKFKVEASKFFGMAEKVLYAAGESETISAMSCIYIKSGGGKVQFAGLDGHRVAWEKQDGEGEFEMMVPRRSVEKILPIGLSGEMEVTIGGSSVSFFTEDCRITARLAKGKYFDLEEFFKREGMKVKAEKKPMLGALSRAWLCLTADKTTATLEFTDAEAEISAMSPKGEYKETVPIEGYSGEAMKISFNCQYLMDAIGSIDSDEVEIYLESPVMPMMLKEEGNEYKALVLPVRI